MATSNLSNNKEVEKEGECPVLRRRRRRAGPFMVKNGLDFSYEVRRQILCMFALAPGTIK